MMESQENGAVARHKKFHGTSDTSRLRRLELNTFNMAHVYR